MRAGVGVGGVDIDILDRNAERLGANLAGDRFHALAEIDRRQRDGEFAARDWSAPAPGSDRRRDSSDRVVDRRHAASAMPGHGQRLRCRNGGEPRRAVPGSRCGRGGCGGGGAACGAGAIAGCGIGWLRCARPLVASCRCAGLSRCGRGHDPRRMMDRRHAPRLPRSREFMRLNSSRIGHFAFLAATCTHSISAVFFASRRCAFMSPSR